MQLLVHRTSAFAYLHVAHGPFDLVFLDPPYDIAEHELTSALELLHPSLAPFATVIVERASRSPQPALPPGLVLDRSKRYGDTTLWWASADETESAVEVTASD